MLSPRLRTLLGAEFEEIEEEHLANLVANAIPESDDLDYKEGQYDRGPKGTFEIAKDVTAFANEIGGLILIGIGETQGVATELKPLELATEVEGRMAQALAIKVYPSVRDVKMRRVRSTLFPGHIYLLIYVPRSSAAPHGVQIEPIDQNPLVWPSRTGATTRFLREGELAARYRDRFDLARGQIDRLARIHDEATQRPEAISIRGLPMDLALVPESVVRHPSHRTVAELLEFLHGYDLGYEAFGISRAGAKFQTRRRRSRITAGGVRWELYLDGCAWIRVIVGVPTFGDYLAIDIRDLEAKLVAMVDSAARFSLWTGASGDAAISLRVGGKTTGQLRLIDGDDGAILGESVGAVINPVELTWSLADLTSQTGAHQAAYELASDIEQDLGIAAPLLDSQRLQS